VNEEVEGQPIRATALNTTLKISDICHRFFQENSVNTLRSFINKVEAHTYV
jgi:stage V sporulation protein SpoVS